MTTSTSHRSRRHQKARPWLLFQTNPLLTLVFLLALVVPLLPGPKPALPWDGVSGAVFEVGGVLLLAAALWRADGPGMGRALDFARRGPTPWLLGLAAWAALAGAFASGGTVVLQGLLHLGAGLLVYATAAYRVRRDADYRLLLDILTAVTLLVCLVGIGSVLARGAMEAGALNHRAFGALLMLLLPLAILSAGAPGTPTQRGAGQASAVLCAIALLLARWHPAERGALLALLLLGFLCWCLKVRVWPTGETSVWTRLRAAMTAKRSSDRHRNGSRSGRHGRREARAAQRRTAWNTAIYGITIMCGLAVFLALTPGGSGVLRQARLSLSAATPARVFGSVSPARLFRGVSFEKIQSGLARASSGALSSDTPEGRQSAPALLAMIGARPFQGWGIGCYPVFQQAWTHQGDEAAVVLRRGPQPTDRARSFYFQTAVELGLPGLALWAGALALFFVGAGRALTQPDESPLRRRVLIGCLAAVTGQVVEAYSDGSWQLGALSLFLWLVLGLGIAASGRGDAWEKRPVHALPLGTALAQAGWQAQVRFAVVCVLCAALLALIVRTSG